MQEKIMQEKIDTITFNDVQYVRKDQAQANQPAKELDGLKYVIVRTYSAGVFAGYLKEEKEKEQVVILLQARRLYQWAGSATLSQMAMEGTTNPNGCKFPMPVAEIKLFQVIEVAPTTEKARLSIASVKEWKC